MSLREATALLYLGHLDSTWVLYPGLTTVKLHSFTRDDRVRKYIKKKQTEMMSAVRKCLGSLILQQTWSPRGLRNLRALGKGINLRPRSSGRSWFVRHCAFAAFPALRGHSEPGCPDWSPQSQPGTRAIVNASRSLRHRSTGLLEAWLFLMYYMQFAHHTHTHI